MADRGQASSNPLHSSENPSQDDDQTWLDFLRSAGGTVSSSTPTASASTTLPRPHLPHSESSDRKRRLTTAEQGRNYPYIAPGTRAEPIDLTSPPRAQGHMRGHTTGSVGFTTNPVRRQSDISRRRSSDLMPPPWQPDAEVGKCPVCEQEFGFLFRKHHCRKCGRVICANCSPHRITIPREYIVQPPGSQDGLPIMGGAEVVRVCKPCVPDPWTPPAPQVPNAQPSHEAPRFVPTGSRRASEASQSRYHRRPSVPVPNIRPPPDDSRFPSYREFLPRSHASHILSSSSSHSSHRPRGQTVPTQPPVVLSSSTLPHNTPQPRRRQIREEDECPVCGIEMPPGESVREAHIQTCVSSRFSTPPTHTPPVPSLAPIPPTNPHDPNLPSTTSPTADTEAARARAMSYRSRGIFPYIATEKDCVDGEDREQECTICMEEFQPGEEMGRLECLCKFHRKCIRDWWGIKGRGSCPVHVFNE